MRYLLSYQQARSILFYIILPLVDLHQDASALNALCLHKSLFTNRLNETGKKNSSQTIILKV